MRKFSGYACLNWSAMPLPMYPTQLTVLTRASVSACRRLPLACSIIAVPPLKISPQRCSMDVACWRTSLDPFEFLDLALVCAPGRYRCCGHHVPQRSYFAPMLLAGQGIVRLHCLPAPT